MSKEKDKGVSFLHEFQIEGKSQGKLSLQNWEEAMETTHKILTPQVVDQFRKTDWEKVPAPKLLIYCQDCRLIVPPEFKKFKGKSRAVCGLCGSKKIASGKEEALKKFYHIDSEEEDDNTEKKSD